MVIHKRTQLDRDLSSVGKLIAVAAFIGLAIMVGFMLVGCTAGTHFPEGNRPLKGYLSVSDGTVPDRVHTPRLEQMPGNWQTVETGACTPACLTITVLPENTP